MEGFLAGERTTYQCVNYGQVKLHIGKDVTFNVNQVLIREPTEARHSGARPQCGAVCANTGTQSLFFWVIDDN